MFSPPFMTLLPGSAVSPEITTRVGLALTYDEVDYNTVLTWTRLGDGPRITPQGLLGDGYTARLRATTIPTWLDTNTDVLTVHASIQPLYEARHTTRDTVVFVGNNDATANPKLEFCIVDDGSLTTEPNVAVRCYTGSMQTKNLCRRNWRYRFRTPDLVNGGGQPARPQGVLHIGPDRMLITVHFNDTASRCYLMETSTGRQLDYFDFAAGNHHVAAIAKRASDSTYWFADYATGDLLQVDLTASFASHSAVVLLTYTLDSDTVLSTIEWATFSGTEYLLFGQYLTSGTPYIYVVNASDVVNGNTFSTASRVKRMVCTLRLQGMTYYGGQLYVASNLITGDAAAYGRIQKVDFATFMASGADGASFTTYAGTSYYGPSEYPEDLSFGPDGELWTATEGRISVGSDNGWLAFWSSPLTDVENHYTAYYDGASSVTLKINNRLFEVMSWTPTINPAAVSIGGPPQASAGQQNGFFIGTVRNVVIQDSALTDAGYGSAVLGRYEPSTLTSFSLPGTNLDCESVTGWTNETGTLATRASNPLPHSGSNYFSGGSNAATKARQRFDLLALTGLTGTQVDAGGLWASLQWWQNSFVADTDTVSLGIRYLNASQVQISENIPTLINITPQQTAWVLRSYGLSIPSGTRYIDIVYSAVRGSGTNLDGYIDDMSLKVFRQ